MHAPNGATAVSAGFLQMSAMHLHDLSRNHRLLVVRAHPLATCGASISSSPLPVNLLSAISPIKQLSLDLTGRLLRSREHQTSSSSKDYASRLLALERDSLLERWSMADVEVRKHHCLHSSAVSPAG